MLYDPKWEAPVKADPFSLESLVAWLEKQPADKPYCYTSNGGCLLAQYFSALGYRNVEMSTDHFLHCGCRERLPSYFNLIAIGSGRTFGHALRRANTRLRQKNVRAAKAAR
jgi:hypothetical protein